MNIRLYAVRLDRALGEAETPRLHIFFRLNAKCDPIVPRTRRKRSARMRCWRRALHDRYGWEKLPEISRGAHGKPYFAAYPDVCFSLSHSHGAVLLAVHDHSIGADIERLRPVSEQMRARFQASDDVSFWQLWVQRESRCKRRGISAVSMRNGEMPVVPNERVFVFSPFSDSLAGICTDSNAETDKLIRLTVDELI